MPWPVAESDAQMNLGKEDPGTPTWSWSESGLPMNILTQSRACFGFTDTLILLLLECLLFHEIEQPCTPMGIFSANRLVFALQRC